MGEDMKKWDNLPKQVILCECWTRDGLQNEKTIVSKEDKIRMINWMQDIGFNEIEVTNFSNPKYIPQFADAFEVLEGIKRKPGVRFRAIVTNAKALDRCIEAKGMGFPVDAAAMVISASEAHNKANVNMTHAEIMPVIERNVERCLANGIGVQAWILTAFGCPIAGDVPIETVAKLAKWWKSIGATQIGFGDTTGMCNPKYASYFYEYMKDQGFTPEEIIVHFHDTRGMGIANNVAALQAGMIYFDTSLGAIGGQPATGAELYHYGYSGNTSSEDLICMFEEMGVKTGINLEELIKAGLEAEKILGRQLRSNVIQCGPVQHEPHEYQAHKS
ncbi:MAG: hydroxymethylglutaryl-CoA lyase [Bacillota bacterium]